MIARAPGKLVVAGEYAVLHGHPALVMAVDRHAVSYEDPSGGGLPPEARCTLEIARREGWLQEDHPHLALDLRALRGEDGHKLGLGSSAAGCVAALALAGALEGRTYGREVLARLARRGHRQAQGGGSGVEAWASALGGLLHVGFPAGLEGTAGVTGRTWPAGVPWAVLWTGSPARTGDLLAPVEAWRARAPRAHAEAMRDLGAATVLVDRALLAGDAQALVSAVGRHLAAMEGLGRRSGAPVVTEPVRGLAQAAAALGAAVKPSGAGGGDVALAVAPDGATLEAVVQIAQGFGLTRLELSLDTAGVQVEEGSWR